MFAPKDRNSRLILSPTFIPSESTTMAMAVPSATETTATTLRRFWRTSDPASKRSSMELFHVFLGMRLECGVAGPHLAEIIGLALEFVVLGGVVCGKRHAADRAGYGLAVA